MIKISSSNKGYVSGYKTVPISCNFLEIVNEYKNICVDKPSLFFFYINKSMIEILYVP